MLIFKKTVLVSLAFIFSQTTVFARGNVSDHYEQVVLAKNTENEIVPLTQNRQNGAKKKKAGEIAGSRQEQNSSFKLKIITLEKQIRDIKRENYILKQSKERFEERSNHKVNKSEQIALVQKDKAAAREADNVKLKKTVAGLERQIKKLKQEKIEIVNEKNRIEQTSKKDTLKYQQIIENFQKQKNAVLKKDKNTAKFKNLNNVLTSKNTKLKKTVADLETAVKKFEQKAETGIERSKKIIKQLKAQQQLVLSKDKENAELKAQVLGLNQSNEKLMIDIKRFEAEAAKAKQIEAAAGQSSAKLKAIQDSLKEQKQTNISKDSENTKLKASNAELLAKLKKFEQHKRLIERSKVKLEQKVKTEIERSKKVLNQLKTQQQLVLSKDKENAELKAQVLGLNQSNEKLVIEITQLKAEIAKAAQAEAMDESQEAGLQEKLKQTGQVIANKDKTIAFLKNRENSVVEKSKKLFTTVKKLKIEIVKWSQKNKFLLNSIDLCKTQITELNKRVKVQEQIILENDRLIDSLKRKNGLNLEELKEFESKIKKLEANTVYLKEENRLMYNSMQTSGKKNNESIHQLRLNTSNLKRENLQLKEKLSLNYHKLGEIYTQNALYPEAIEAYQRALNYNPVSSLSYYYLGLIYAYSENDRDKAVDYLKKYLDLEKTNKNKEKVKALIDLLGSKKKSKK